MSSMVDLMGVVTVVGRQDRSTDLLGDLQKLRIGTNLLGNPVVLQFDKQVVSTKDVLQSAGAVDGFFKVALQKRLQDLTAQTTSSSDDPFGVLIE